MSEPEQKKCVMAAAPPPRTNGAPPPSAAEAGRALTDEKIEAVTEGFLDRAAISGMHDEVIEPVPVPEWGGTVCVRSLSGKERDDFEETIRKSGGNRLANFRARFAALVLCDTRGRRLFSEPDVPLLGQKSAAALERILDVGMRLSRMGPRDVETLTKNLESDRTDDSGSD